jgi:hypothetical protein
MFSSARRHLTYANVAVTVALVFAMTGGAYAAGKYLITSTKQISPKVLKSLQGKTGPAGANGANGVAGAQGPAGPQGAVGNAGTAGSNGTSVTSAESKTKIGPCKEGGSEFKAASGSTFACNGEKGKEGSPWTASGTLPEGQTLTGFYSGTGYSESEETGRALASASFALPLVALFKQGSVSYIKEGESLPEGCTGNVHQPGAAPGHLCIFAEDEVNVTANTRIQIESSTFGFILTAISATKGQMVLTGSWAVTAEAA